MPYTIQLSDSAWNELRHYAGISSRSIVDQAEYWLGIGKMAEENPDLPYGFIRDVLISKQEADDGELTEYRPG